MTAHPSLPPRRSASDLTPKRRDWLREHIRGFADMQDAIQKADENAEKARRRALGESQADESGGGQ